MDGTGIMASSKSSAILEPLNSSDFISTLREFLRMLQSCVGHKAGVKLLVSSGGITTLTSSSSRLLSNTVLNNPICVMISQIMKSQLESYRDFGLYTGIMAASLLAHVLTQQTGMPQNRASHLIQLLSHHLTSLLNSPSIKLDLDFSTVKQLLAVAQTVLSSKPACGLMKSEIIELSIMVVKSFLNSVDMHFGEVIIKCSEDVGGENYLFQGILYQSDLEGQALRVLNQNLIGKSNIHIILFNIMLTNETSSKSKENHSGFVLECVEECEDTVSNDIVNQALVLLKQAVQENVGIVACQKVVNSALHLFLQRNGILLLDRMGAELTRAVEKLTGAIPISSVAPLPDGKFKSYLGTVDRVRQVTCGTNDFILLESAQANVTTLVISGPTEEACLELKLVVGQTLAALRQLVNQPVVVPGAGCLEVWLATELQIQALRDPAQFECSCSQLEAGIGWMQRSLLDAAGFPPSLSSFLTVDSVHHHGWQQHESSNCLVCLCGLVTKANVEEAGGHWVEPTISGIQGSLMPNFHTLSTAQKPELRENVLIDVYAGKCNAIKLALESCAHMLSIGLIIYKCPV